MNLSNHESAPRSGIMAPGDGCRNLRLIRRNEHVGSSAEPAGAAPPHLGIEGMLRPLAECQKLYLTHGETKTKIPTPILYWASELSWLPHLPSQLNSATNPLPPATTPF